MFKKQNTCDILERWLTSLVLRQTVDTKFAVCGRTEDEAGGRRAPTNRQTGPRRAREGGETPEDREPDHRQFRDDVGRRRRRHTDTGRHVRQLVTFRVSRRRREMYCGHARLCVCMSVCRSAAACPCTLLHRPGCNLGEW